MKQITIFLILFVSNFSFSQNYFSGIQSYVFSSVYVSERNDTIKGAVVFTPKKSPWIFQPWKQKTMIYEYFTHIEDLKKYIVPNKIQQEIRDDYFQKNGQVKFLKIEKTGGYSNKDFFYIHPPRINQFTMLFYAPHFFVAKKFITDSTEIFSANFINIIGLGRPEHIYTVSPINEKRAVNNEDVSVWNIQCNSTFKNLDNTEKAKIYNSKLTFLYSEEYGPIEAKYEFENGVQIMFKLNQIIPISN